MPAANIGPTSGVNNNGGGIAAILAGMSKGSPNKGGGTGNNTTADGFNPFMSRGQFKRFMMYQDSKRNQDRVDMKQSVMDADTLNMRQGALDMAKAKQTGQIERQKMSHENKLQEKTSQADFGREQARTTSQRIYEESTKDTAFTREQKTLNAASRRTRKERDQTAGRMTQFLKDNPGTTELNLNNPKSGDTVKVAPITSSIT